MPRVSLVEALGLSPASLALQQLGKVFRGDPHTPKSRFDHTSLRIFKPKLSVQTWLGRKPFGRDIAILNFVNRTPTPVAEGWSVRKTQTRDWRGGSLTYDSHNGTDFIVPPGTRICAAAPGVVTAIRREFNRGGLKVYVDHGRSLVTTYNHLARSLVVIGQRVARSEVIALSGSSGADSTLMFPWAAPHLHFNVLFGGVAVDPYADDAAGASEVSLWRARNDPRPCPADDVEAGDDVGGSFDDAGVARCLAVCEDPAVVATVAALVDSGATQRAGMELLIESFTYPTRFRVPEAGRLLFAAPAVRWPALDLPFAGDEFDRAIVV